MFKIVQNPMEQMLIHIFLTAVRNFTDAVLKEFLHWILVFVDVTRHKILIVWKIITKVHKSLPVDVSHNIIISWNDCSCSFTLVNTSDSSKMITWYQKPKVKYLISVKVQYINNTVSANNKEYIIAGISFLHNGLFRLRKPCAKSLYNGLHDAFIDWQSCFYLWLLDMS